jgi:hypothetical protein
MEHHMSAISSHCAQANDPYNTVHWIWAICTCGQAFSEASTSTDYRAAADALSRKAMSHVTQANQEAQLADA